MPADLKARLEMEAGGDVNMSWIISQAMRDSNLENAAEWRVTKPSLIACKLLSFSCAPMPNIEKSYETRKAIYRLASLTALM